MTLACACSSTLIGVNGRRVGDTNSFHFSTMIYYKYQAILSGVTTLTYARDFSEEIEYMRSMNELIFLLHAALRISLAKTYIIKLISLS